MRVLATSLLAFAGVVYGVTLHRGGWVGFVNTGAEAAMVGAMADWFAVTALFKHPLGLPIPHTALVPKRKDEFAASLEAFFTENFLQEDVIRDRVTAADVVRRVGEWLTVAENSQRVAQEAAQVISIAVSQMKEDDVRALVEEALLPRLREEPVAPVAGALLAEVVADKAHHAFVDLMLEELHRWLENNEATFTAVLGERAPVWVPERLNEMVTQRIHLEAVRWLDDIRRDPWHHARFALDSMLRQLAADLLENPETQERAETLKARVLAQPQVVAASLSLWEAFRRALLASLDEAEGPLQLRAAQEVQAFGNRIGADDAFRARLERWLADIVVWAVDRYGDEVAGVITHTIQRWDGREASHKIELHVGPDLQFIRINGTVVGALVGVLIHGLTVLAS